MPPIPPMPQPLGIGGALSFLGASVIIASVVTSKPATDAAFWSAARTTFAGSTMLLGLCVEAEGLRLVVGDPADHDRALDARVFGARTVLRDEISGKPAVITDRSAERV
jgi:hypothetical protein